MYKISETGDISQLLIKPQLRGGQTVLMLIKGFDDKGMCENILHEYSQKCAIYNVYYNKNIVKPTYDETQEFLSLGVVPTDNMQIGIENHCTSYFSDVLTQEQLKSITEAIKTVLVECIDNNVAYSIFKNGYIRLFVALKKRFLETIQNIGTEQKILYVGKPDKFDILLFTVLGLCGCDVVIVDFLKTQTSECLCNNRFITVTGCYSSEIDLGFLEYVEQGISDISNGVSVPNAWVNFKDYTDLGSVLRLYNWEIDKRLEGNKWRTLNVELTGVSDVHNYASSVDNFFLSANASKRKVSLIDGTLQNPSFEEVSAVTSQYKNLSCFEILQNYPAFAGSGVVVKITEAFENIQSKHSFSTESQKNSYIQVLYIWLIRYLNMFFTATKINVVPLVITFGNLNSKTWEFLDILRLFPVDILCLRPNFATCDFGVLQHQTFNVISLGASTVSLQTFPTNTGGGQIETVAFNAERELDTLLYTDTSLYRVKQFKKMTAVVLKTTYEEIAILWKEVSKVRPSFSSVQDLVTIPTIFAKINGVNNTYDSDVRYLMGKDTLFYQNFPIVPTETLEQPVLKGFLKQVVFKDSVDYARIIKSPYYTYGVYSEETQNLIQEKIDTLIHMNWCVDGDKNLVYDILAVGLNLPTRVLQTIHNYDFTANIPKLVLYFGGTSGCNLHDSIFVMLLKLLGFDIVLFTPTGYRVIEQYIGTQWFNDITIGQFDFDRPQLSFNETSHEKKKKGIWSLFE